MSAIRPKRPSGIFRVSFSLSSGISSRFIPSVSSIGPGAMPFTRIPWRPTRREVSRDGVNTGLSRRYIYLHRVANNAAVAEYSRSDLLILQGFKRRPAYVECSLSIESTTVPKPLVKADQPRTENCPPLHEDNIDLAVVLNRFDDSILDRFVSRHRPQLKNIAAAFLDKLLLRDEIVLFAARDR